MYNGRLEKKLEAKVFWNILISGKIKPNINMTVARTYSRLRARVCASDINENSDEKNQNPSILAKGKLTPNNNNTNSRKITGIFQDRVV